MYKGLVWGILSIVLILLLFPTGCGILNSNDIKSTTTEYDGTKSSKIASVEGMRVFISLNVELKPIDAQPNVTYPVDLFEKGKLRASSKIKWNAPQINVKESQQVSFGLTKEEENAYSTPSAFDSDWWKPIFSIKIREPIPPPTGIPFINLIYPNGGENWYIRDNVNIKWTSTNLEGVDVDMIIRLSYDGGKTWPYTMNPTTGDTIPNTGSFAWIVSGATSTHCRIALGIKQDSSGKFAWSNGDFTISAPKK
jgi:hypothetical protein